MKNTEVKAADDSKAIIKAVGRFEANKANQATDCAATDFNT